MREIQNKGDQNKGTKGMAPLYVYLLAEALPGIWSLRRLPAFGYEL